VSVALTIISKCILARSKSILVADGDRSDVSIFFFKTVALVDFLQVELEFVVIHDCNVQSYKRVLVIVEAFSKRCQVLDGVVPLCVVCFLEFLLRLNVERTPAIDEVLENLVGGDVAVRC